MFKKNTFIKLFNIILLIMITNNSFGQATGNQLVTAPNKLNFKNSGSSNSSSDFNHIENYSPFSKDLPNQALMVAPAKSFSTNDSKMYILPATPATTQWGYFDNSQPPVLRINSGDSVAIETLTASDNQVLPGLTFDKLLQISKAVPGRGPHTITGPIYVNGAEPGDVLQIHFNKIIPKSYASNDTIPGKGLLPKEFPQGQIKYFYLDVGKKQMQFAPGIIIPLHPFPGLIAVAQAKAGKFNTDPPGRFGGNLDLREMTQGSSIYLPVFVKGGLIWTGDSHAGQGNGEIDLTAIETAFQEFNITVKVIKHHTLEWPRVETPRAWITVGYDKDLNKALDILKGQTVKFLMEKYSLNHEQAEKRMFQTWNCPISEVVNGVQGVYCIIPKDSHTLTPLALPTQDNMKYYVTYARNSDVEEAMRKASLDMINKIVAQKKLMPSDAYILASFTMDCRISPYQSGDKEVHCMLPKNLWTSPK